MPPSDAVAVPPGPPSMDDVRQIAAMQDVIVRNLRITLAYHELGLALSSPPFDAAQIAQITTVAPQSNR